MTTLLIATHNNKKLNAATRKTVSAAKPLDEELHVLVAGEDCLSVALSAAKISGVRKVIHVEGEAYGNDLSEPVSDLILKLSQDYTHIVFPATSSGKSIAPRVAALLDVMIIPDVITINSPEEFARPVYAGNALQIVRSSDPVKVLTVRSACFEPAPEQQSVGIETLSVSNAQQKSRWVEDCIEDTDRPELAAARVVVSGGRGLGSEENFSLIGKLGTKLNAAIGASRAAVDSGYAPNDCQVGQTGVIVAPELYIAVGISGAIQHIAGIKDSKTIVAINSDPDAPIFQIADYGLIADLFEALPELIEKLD